MQATKITFSGRPVTPHPQIVRANKYNGQQKKGRPNGRPHIALDCCAPIVHPYTMETSLQLALPAPYKCVGTSLLASLLLPNIGGHSVAVKHLLIIFVITYIYYLKLLLFNNLYYNHFFNILNNCIIFVLLHHIFGSPHEEKARG